jgi:hypothetical protein
VAVIAEWIAAGGDPILHEVDVGADEVRALAGGGRWRPDDRVVVDGPVGV